MGYYQSIQRAIDYIEEHLWRDTGVGEISALAGYSVPHFYRVFGGMVGMSVKEYVRRRRLSCAAHQIVMTTRNIIDIALDAGYESHEAFTRTYKAVFGETPTGTRARGTVPASFEKADLLSIMRKRKGSNMNPKFEERGEIKLVGVARRINQGEQVRNDVIGKVREEFFAMAGAIEGRADNLFYAAYDYQPEDLEKDDDEIDYTYYYCVRVKSFVNVPDGMIKKTIAPAKYAVFSYDAAEETLCGEKIDMPVYDYIDGIWLPESGCELTDSADYEAVDRADGRIDFCVSIR